jgi:exosortase
METTSSPTVRNILLTALLALTILAYLPALAGLVSDWYHDANYSHGFLVPLISGYLFWIKRKELAEIKISSSGVGLFIIGAGMILFILGNGASEYFTVRFSFVVTLFGIILYNFGKAITRRVWFALFFLLFMIPIPYVIYFSATFPMQLLASKITIALLNLTGMPAVRQGNIIYLPNQALEVAEACSGVRSLVSLLALGALYAYISQKKFPAQVLLFLSTIPLAVIGNIFRVLVTSIIVYATDAHVTDEPLHTIMGASVFAIAFVTLFILSAILRKFYR